MVVDVDLTYALRLEERTVRHVAMVADPFLLQLLADLGGEQVLRCAGALGDVGVAFAVSWRDEAGESEG